MKFAGSANGIYLLITRFLIVQIENDVVIIVESLY